MAFSCYSTTALGCGSLHRTLLKAKACCRVHGKMYDEERQPVPVSNKQEADANFPASESAAARRAEWRAVANASS